MWIMSNLVNDPRVIGVLTFLAGLLVAKTVARARSRSTEKDSRANDRLLRSLEADLRVTKKNLAKTDEELQSTNVELQTANQTVADLNKLVEERAKEVEEAKELLKSECEKTRSLREDLSGRAEETIRAEVYARQMEVELSVVKAGTSAVHEEVDRLAAERQELTGRLRQLEDEFLSVEADDDDGLEESLDLDEPLIGL